MRRAGFVGEFVRRMEYATDLVPPVRSSCATPTGQSWHANPRPGANRGRDKGRYKLSLARRRLVRDGEASLKH